MKDQLPKLVDLAEKSEIANKHFFSPEANWLVPGRILVGRYPANDPYIVCSPDEQYLKIEKIVLEGRVTTFICLQAELPPQTKDSEGMLSWVNGEIPSGHTRLGGVFTRYMPDAVKVFESKKRDGLFPAAKKLDFVHMPIPDLSPAKSISLLQTYVQEVLRRVSNQEIVYLHCWGGCGRTGLVSACLLGELYGISADEALERVDKYFKLRSKEALAPHSRSPETDAQIFQVKRYFSEFI